VIELAKAGKSREEKARIMDRSPARIRAAAVRLSVAFKSTVAPRFRSRANCSPLLKASVISPLALPLRLLAYFWNGAPDLRPIFVWTICCYVLILAA